ncbi:accessory factor associated with RNA polymerase II [Dipsacomyces acuminosporus]|nr:accessory factor associated with RNA polymerase II [Dipsacomyces acuminosporus]
MATSGPNPLELLRQYTMQKKSIEFIDGDGNLTKDLLKAATVRFGEDASFPRDTPTSYSRGNNEADQYTLSALLHFLDHRDQSFYEYMKTTNTLGLQTVSFGDRINLLDYLTGKSAAAGQGNEPQAGDKHANAAGSADDSGRRTRMKIGGGADGTHVATSANDIARDIMRRERLIVTTSTALSSSKTFARVPGLIKELFPPKSAAGASGGLPGKAEATGAASGASGSALRRAGHRKRKDPIVVVPAATTAMINMYNIKALLKDHQFVDSKDVMAKGETKPREVVVEHTMSGGGPSLKFRIVDSVQDFTEADWSSLVCVFTQGAAWQFKNWSWSTPEEVFQNCVGYYPKYQDERPKDTTRSWGISMLNIERSKRHTDRATVVGLWNNIEQYMRRSKPEFFE